VEPLEVENFTSGSPDLQRSPRVDGPHLISVQNALNYIKSIGLHINMVVRPLHLISRYRLEWSPRRTPSGGARDPVRGGEGTPNRVKNNQNNQNNLGGKGSGELQ
jgi:hypothetical protein